VQGLYDRVAMRIRPSLGLLPVVAMIAACGVGTGAPGNPGWQGPEVHLVDGTWIGTEVSCGADDLECRTVIDLTMSALQPDVHARVTRAALATLPTEFVTATGETRSAHISAGILIRKAVVLDLAGGTRRVIGQWCHLPYSGNGGGLIVRDADCDIAPLDYWLDGNAPPSDPPGSTVG
jgi:hypothetical protein